MNAYILGLDVSTTCTGYCFLSLDYKNDRDIRFGKIIPPKSTPKNPVSWFRRASFTYTALEQLLEGVAVAAVGIEILNSFRGGEVTRQLAGINMGAQYLVYKRFGIEAVGMNTMTMKKGFTGSGAAKKPDMVAAANRIYGLSLRWPERPSDQANKEVCDDDVADAIAAAHVLEAEAGDDLRAALSTEAGLGE